MLPSKLPSQKKKKGVLHGVSQIEDFKSTFKLYMKHVSVERECHYSNVIDHFVKFVI